MKRRITSKEIAKLAKVSQSAVSRAFLPNASISSKLKQRVLKVALENGFSPNAMASTLITGNSKIIGLVMAYLDNMFYPHVMENLSLKLREQGYHVLLFIGDESGNADKLFSDIMRYQVDGIVLASTALSSNLSEQCMEFGIPVILFNRFSKASDFVSVVASDNFSGGERVAQFLCAGGHERISYIAGMEDSSTNEQREKGFLKGLADHGRSLFSRGVSNYRFDAAQSAAREMFKGSTKRRPDAVFAANDHVCIAVLEVLRYELGLRVPEDVSLIGYDNVPLAGLKAFSLTTVEQRYTEMVDMAVQTLINQIEMKSIVPRKIILHGDLIIRDSARLPKSGQIKQKGGVRYWIPE